jgi:hypothetical protein
MINARLSALAARALILAFATLAYVAPARAQSDESAIRRAFDDFRQMAKPGMAAAPAIMPPDMAAFYAHVGRKAYGVEALGAASGPFLEAYSIVMLRGVALCAYLGAERGVMLRTLQGEDGVGIFDFMRRAGVASPWAGADEQIGQIQIAGDTATVEYRWSGSRALGRGAPLSFSDKIEFRRAGGRWLLAFDSYVAMLDRHWPMLASSILAKIEPNADPGSGKDAAALDVATARAFDHMDTDACPDSRAHLERLKNAKRTDAIENFRVRLGKVLQTPIQDWPEPKVLAWWNN